MLSNNCGDLVHGALAAGGISIPDTVNPQASINNMDRIGNDFSNQNSGDYFIDITPDER